MLGRLYHLTAKSGNEKTGPIPVSTSPRSTCPTSCPVRGSGGCYGEQGKIRFWWDKVDTGTAKNLLTWEELCMAIEELPEGQMWRHNQVGDLPKTKEGKVRRNRLRRLTRANRGKLGWTYTHHPVKANLAALREANAGGFTVNVSANNLAQADEYAATGLPTVCILPKGCAKVTITPEGRTVVLCPAQLAERLAKQGIASPQDSCVKCGNGRPLCQRANRGYIVGFEAHGSSSAKVSRLALELPVL